MELDEFEGRTIRGLAPLIEDDREAGFRAVLKRLKPPRRVLEVGTVGGIYTTTHLLDLCPKARIDILEIRKDRVKAARANFAADPRSSGRVKVHHADARRYRSWAKFDLIVIDVQFDCVDIGYEQILPKLSGLLSKGGGIFLNTIYDTSVAFGVADDGKLPLGGREAQEAFMLRYFGATRLTLEILQARMRREGFAALALVDRWLLTGGRRGHGLVYMERLTPTS